MASRPRAAQSRTTAANNASFDERVFRRVRLIERRLRDAGPRGDGVHGGAGEAVFEEHGAGRGQQFGALAATGAAPTAGLDLAPPVQYLTVLYRPAYGSGNQYGRVLK
jgi:hypothetical protein